MTEKNKEKAYQGCGLALVWLVLLLVGWLICSCKSVEYVPVVQKETHTDSIYLTKVQRDSIWLHDSIRVEARNDTVRVDRWHTKYVERLLHDTLYLSKRDTIPVPYEVVKEVPAKVSKMERAFMWLGILSLMALTLLVGRWLSKHV
jgi:hypothetical protein